FSQRGTPASKEAATSTRVRPNSTRTEPSAWSSQFRVIRTSRSCSGVRPSCRGLSVMTVRLTTASTSHRLGPMQQHAEIPLSDGGRTVLHTAPAADAQAPVVLVLPAMGVPAGYYEPFVDDLARTGVTAAVADYPGQGAAVPAVGPHHHPGSVP